MCADMRIIPRVEWGARYPNGFGPAPLPAAEVWLHHSVTAAANGAAIIRDLEQIGQNRFGGGISYTWPITPDGTIYEGHSVNRRGSHTSNRNDIARAICFVGNYETIRPTTAQVHSAAWLLQYAHSRGWIRAPRLTGGHRDLKATACPGRYAYAAIPTINQLAAGGPIQEADVITDAEKEVLLAGARSVQFGLAGVRSAGELALAVDEVRTQLRALAGALSDDEAKILAAVQGVHTAVEADDETVTLEQLDYLAAALAARVPATMADEFDTRLRAAFARAAQPEAGTQ